MPRFPVRHFHTAFLAIALLAPASSTFAATLRGVVLDPDGEPIPNARVVVTSSTQTIATAITDREGRYSMDALPAGRYSVLAVRDGLRAAAIDIEITADDVRDLPIAMSISALSEGIVVSADHVDLPLSHAADAVTVIPASTIAARQIESVADALRTVPGFTVARSGGRGALTSIFPRGGDSDYTLVLIDGLKANAFGGGFDFSQLSTSEVEQIEVVRGPQSALFGSDAIGGVVQLVTRHGGPLRVHGLFEAGSFDTVRSGASAAGSIRAFTWSASGEGWKTAGFEGTAPATGETVGNDDGRLVEGAVGAGWSSPRVGELRFDARVSDSARGFPGPFGSNPIGAFTEVDRISRGDRERRQVGLRYTTFLGNGRRVRQRASVSHASLDGRFVSAFSPDKPSNDLTRRVATKVQTDVQLGARAALSGGLEHTAERGGSTFIVDASGQRIDIRRRVTGYFAEARAHAGARLFAASGLRIENIHRDEVPTDGGSRPSFAAESIVSLNPKVAITFYARPDQHASSRIGWTRVHFTAGTGIRPPDAFEIAFTDNPSLQPERSRSVDVGIGQALAGGALLLDVTVFANHYDDLIVAVGREQRDASRYRTDNISNARARGLELSMTARTRIGIDVQAAYTVMQTKVLPVDGASGLAPSPFKPGDPLIRRPRHQGSLSATMTRRRVTAYFELNGRGRALDIEPNYGALFGGMFTSRGYVVSSAGASVAVARGIEAYGRLQNLFDRQYEEVFGFPSLGRSVTGGVRVAVSR